MSYYKPCSLFLATIFFVGCTAKTYTSFATPVAFHPTQYCDRAEMTGVLEIPAAITKILAKENPNVTEDQIAEALLTKAAMQVAHHASSAEHCKTIFSKGEALFGKVLGLQQKSLRKAGKFKPSKQPSILTIQKDITKLWRDDQSARGAYVTLATKDRTGAQFWAQRLATAHTVRMDALSKPYIETLMESYNWIDSKRFGRKASAHAWILVQHADDHPDFQAKVLRQMEPYLKSGDIKPANYAYLWDRVAINTGRKQRYGTQPTWECTDGKLELQPLENPKTVNERRAKMNMGSVEAGLAQMAQGVCKQ